MGLQYSVGVNNARLDSIETTIGTSAKLRIYTGSAPADCAAAATGTLLVEMALPSDWMAAASGASKVKAGTWTGVASGTGTAGYFRIVDNAGTVTGLQGTAGMSGTDLILNNSSIATSQAVTVDSFSLSTGNT
jgi:hypothetical protein